MAAEAGAVATPCSPTSAISTARRNCFARFGAGRARQLDGSPRLAPAARPRSHARPRLRSRSSILVDEGTAPTPVVRPPARVRNGRPQNHRPLAVTAGSRRSTRRRRRAPAEDLGAGRCFRVRNRQPNWCRAPLAVSPDRPFSSQGQGRPRTGCRSDPRARRVAVFGPVPRDSIFFSPRAASI